MNESKPATKNRLPKRVMFARYRTILLLIVIAVAAGGLIYWSQRMPQEIEPEQPARMSESETTALLEKKEQLATKELIALAANLKLPADASLPVQMRWIDDKTEISRLLLAKTGDELAQKEGTLYRLEALQRLSYINRKYRLGNKTVDAELNDLSLANLDHSDPEISKIAAVTLMLTSIHEFVNQPDATTLSDALRSCRDVATKLSDDEEVASAIFTYARYMKGSDRFVNQLIEFFNVVLDVYLPSNDETASRLASESYDEIVFGDQTGAERFAKLLIAALKDRFRQELPAVEDEVGSRVRYALHDELIDDQGVTQIFRMLEVLLTNERLESATVLMEELEQYFSRSKARELSSRVMPWLKGFATRIQWYDRSIDLSGLTDVLSGDAFERDRKRALFIFWEPDDQPSMRLVSALSGQKFLQNLQIVAICEAPVPENNALLKKFATEMPGIQFVTLPGLTERYPIPALPYLLVIDRANLLVIANPDFKDLGKYIGQVAN